MLTLQFKWDMMLITCFYTNPDRKVWGLCSDFKERYGMWPNEAKLLRIPGNYWQSKMRVASFICNTLPPLGNTLWNKELSDAFDVACKLIDNKLDTLQIAINARQRRAEAAELKASAREYMADRISITRNLEYQEKCNVSRGASKARRFLGMDKRMRAGVFERKNVLDTK